MLPRKVPLQLLIALMSIERTLRKRSNDSCELCQADEHLSVYEIPSSPKSGEAASILLCATCLEQSIDASKIDQNHWRCLNDSMWSTEPAVQVMAWRMLQRVKSFGWSGDLLDMMYLEEEVAIWAAAAGDGKDTSNDIVHRDVNGVVLQAGDSVVLIKDLKVKGSSMVAKQGTAVRRISLDHDNAQYIEGKVDGQHIVIITQYVKKI